MGHLNVFMGSEYKDIIFTFLVSLSEAISVPCLFLFKFYPDILSQVTFLITVCSSYGTICNVNHRIILLSRYCY